MASTQLSATAAEAFNENETGQDIEIFSPVQTPWYFPQDATRTLIVMIMGTEGHPRLEIAGPNDAHIEAWNQSTGERQRLAIMHNMEFGDRGVHTPKRMAIDIRSETDEVLLTVVCEEEEIGVVNLPITKSWIGGKSGFWNSEVKEERLPIKDADGITVATLKLKTQWEDEGAHQREVGSLFFRVCVRPGPLIYEYPWADAPLTGVQMRIGELLEVGERLTDKNDEVWLKVTAAHDNQGRQGWINIKQDGVEVVEQMSRRWTKARAALALQNAYRRKLARRQMALRSLQQALWPEFFAKKLREQHPHSDFARNDMIYKPQFRTITLRELLVKRRVTQTDLSQLLELYGHPLVALLANLGITTSAQFASFDSPEKVAMLADVKSDQASLVAAWETFFDAPATLQALLDEFGVPQLFDELMALGLDNPVPAPIQIAILAAHDGVVAAELDPLLAVETDIGRESYIGKLSNLDWNAAEKLASSVTMSAEGAEEETNKQKAAFAKYFSSLRNRVNKLETDLADIADVATDDSKNLQTLRSELLGMIAPGAEEEKDGGAEFSTLRTELRTVEVQEDLERQLATLGERIAALQVADQQAGLTEKQAEQLGVLQAEEEKLNGMLAEVRVIEEENRGLIQSRLIELREKAIEKREAASGSSAHQAVQLHKEADMLEKEASDIQKVQEQVEILEEGRTRALSTAGEKEQTLISMKRQLAEAESTMLTSNRAIARHRVQLLLSRRIAAAALVELNLRAVRADPVVADKLVSALCSLYPGKESEFELSENEECWIWKSGALRERFNVPKAMERYHAVLATASERPVMTFESLLSKYRLDHLQLVLEKAGYNAPAELSALVNDKLRCTMSEKKRLVIAAQDWAEPFQILSTVRSGAFAANAPVELCLAEAGLGSVVKTSALTGAGIVTVRDLATLTEETTKKLPLPEAAKQKLLEVVYKSKRQVWNKNVWLYQRMVKADIKDDFVQLCFLKWVWKFAMSKVCEKVRSKGDHVSRIQRWFKSQSDRKTFGNQSGSAIKIQAWWRTVVLVRVYTRMRREVVNIQKAMRGDLIFFKHQMKRQASVTLQSWWRGTSWRRFGFHDSAMDFTHELICRKPGMSDAMLVAGFACEARDEEGVWLPAVVHERVDAGNFLMVFDGENEPVNVATSDLRPRRTFLQLGDIHVIRIMATRIQKILRAGGWTVLLVKIKRAVRLVQKVWRGYYRRVWFAEKMRTEIYPVIDAYQYKIGLWNRLARRIHLYFRLKMQVIVIVGDAADLGQTVAKKFVADAFSVIFLCDDLPMDQGNDIAKEVTLCGKGVAYFMRTNTASVASVESMAAQVMQQWGKIDVLVNNSAVRGGDPTPETDHLAVSGDFLTGPFISFKACLPHMQDKRSAVINICPYEIQGEVPSMAGASIKTGLLALTHEIAAQHPNIRCNAVCPLVVMGETTFRHPLKPGIADLTHYIAGGLNECPFMTGQTMVAQGYMTHDSFSDMKRRRGEALPIKQKLTPEEELPPAFSLLQAEKPAAPVASLDLAGNASALLSNSGAFNTQFHGTMDKSAMYVHGASMQVTSDDAYRTTKPNTNLSAAAAAEPTEQEINMEKYRKSKKVGSANKLFTGTR